MGTLTHLDEHGQAHMVDVGDKAPTRRYAIAAGSVSLGTEALEALLSGDTPKGDVLATARIAGIMAAKHTPSLIPLCHPIIISSVKVELTVDAPSAQVRIRARVRADDRTGVEMEALTAVSVAALTIYDMLKAVDKGMSLGPFYLVEKGGGRSGDFKRTDAPEAAIVALTTPSLTASLSQNPAIQHVVPRHHAPQAQPHIRQPISAAARALVPHVGQLSADSAALQNFLRDDLIGAAYLLGDSDSPYADYGHWWGVVEGETIRSALLYYTGLSMPTVLTAGDALAVEALLHARHPELPRRFYASFKPEHQAALEALYELSKTTAMVRMGLPRAQFQPINPEKMNGVVPITHRDTGALMHLFSHYPDNFFDPAQLDTGIYAGIWVDGVLVSVAGVHILSEKQNIATIGNIVTHPEHRRRGYASRCIGSVLNQLFERVSNVALNVEVDNTAAQACYRSFGFEPHHRFFEAWANLRDKR